MCVRVVAASILSLQLAACGAGAASLRPAGGALSPCARDHCVSSQEPGTKYFVEPLRYAGSREQARETLRQIVAGMPGAEVQADAPDYLHATFTSRWMRYVDDLELLFPSADGLVQVRSSSRLGYSDFGVNRTRVEALRARFDTGAQ